MLLYLISIGNQSIVMNLAIVFRLTSGKSGWKQKLQRLVGIGGTRLETLEQKGPEHYGVAMADPEDNELDIKLMKNGMSSSTKKRTESTD